jgi:hypothetical protein
MFGPHALRKDIIEIRSREEIQCKSGTKQDKYISSEILRPFGDPNRGRFRGSGGSPATGPLSLPNVDVNPAVKFASGGCLEEIQEKEGLFVHRERS